MTFRHKPTLSAASLLLALATSLAVAQTAPAKKPAKPAAQPAAKAAGKTLGGNAAGGGKLMTRDELRTCLKRLDDVNQGGKDIEALRPVLDREREELKVSGDALKTERAAIDAQLATLWTSLQAAQTTYMAAHGGRPWQGLRCFTSTPA